MSRRAAAYLIAPILGLGAMVLPLLLQQPKRLRADPLFPLLDHAVEHVGWRQLALLFATGLVFGAISNGGALRLGGASILLLPVAAIAEMFADPTSHNLFPLEFAAYTFYGCLVAAGSAIAQKARRRGDRPNPA